MHRQIQTAHGECVRNILFRGKQFLEVPPLAPVFPRSFIRACACKMRVRIIAWIQRTYICTYSLIPASNALCMHPVGQLHLPMLSASGGPAILAAPILGSLLVLRFNTGINGSRLRISEKVTHGAPNSLTNVGRLVQRFPALCAYALSTGARFQRTAFLPP